MPAPYVRGSATSRSAARSIEPLLKGLKASVYLHIHESGARGMTCDELERRLDMRHQTVSARVRDLYVQGWVYRTQRRRRTRSGREAVVYRTRRKRRFDVVCTCDRPTCSRFPCKQLREYRITHRVVSEIVKVPEFGVDTVRELLDHIESECEILSK